MIFSVKCTITPTTLASWIYGWAPIGKLKEGKGLNGKGREVRVCREGEGMGHPIFANMIAATVYS